MKWTKNGLPWPWFMHAEIVGFLAGLINYYGVHPFFSGLLSSLFSEGVYHLKEGGGGNNYRPLLAGGASYVGAIVSTRIFQESRFSEALGVFLATWAVQYYNFGQYQH